MPQLTIRGIDAEIVAKASEILPPKLANIMNCPEDYFTFDIIETRSFKNGVESPTYPFILILWFERGRTVRDVSAGTVTEVFKELGVDDLEVAFVPSDPAAYYGNGESFARE